MGHKPEHMNINHTDVNSIISAYDTALSNRAEWDNVWQECYKFAHPKFIAGQTELKKQVFDATAPDAVDELAGVIAGELSPRSSQWARIVPTVKTDTEVEVCDLATNVMGNAINDSNFAVEMHQCIVDLIVAGTSIMLVEPAPITSRSPLKFTALDLKSVVLGDSGTGELDTVYRTQEFEYAGLVNVFPSAKEYVDSKSSTKFTVLEYIRPMDGKYMYTAILKEGASSPEVLKSIEYSSPPFIAFRWQKANGEKYGCSPIMKALPDIKTANKVVELTLKNATISVTGIWQADDDGVLNPATIRLTPGTIIPKAVGSSGLQPLKSPGDFNMSNMVLEKLQQRIRRALLADVFSSSISRTATEINENSMRSRQVLNAVYERIVQEFFNPLLDRVYDILYQKGLVPDVVELDLRLDVHSPIERLGDMAKLITIKKFFESASAFPEQLSQAVDITQSIKWLAKEAGLPQEYIINSEDNLSNIQSLLREVSEIESPSKGLPIA